MLQIPKLKTYITDADDMRYDALQQTTWEDMIIHVRCLLYYVTSMFIHLFIHS